jgi:hypothetical protein
MEGSNCACRFNDDDEPVNECRVHADQRREIERLRGEVADLRISYETGLKANIQNRERINELKEQLSAERQRARMPDELEMWARKLIAFDDGCDEAGEQNMTSIYEPLQLLRDLLAWHEQ